MTDKMKEITITILIPKDKEIVDVSPVLFSQDAIIITLAARKPKEIVFREIIGKNYVDDGDYFTDIGTTLPMIKATSHYHLGEGHTVWELVNANT